MAFTNIDTGKIYGAKKGTLSWYHEKGHLAFSKQEFGERIRYGEEVSKDFLLVVLCLSYLIPFNFFGYSWNKFIVLYALGKWLYYYYFEEVWCWLYAYKKKRGVGGASKV